VPDKGPYRMSEEGALIIPLGKGIASQTRNSTAGVLPYLPGQKGFYVEFEMRLSSNSGDHWPALWLMPAEHDLAKRDHYPPDPPGYERWMELDVHEGGFNAGSLNSVISWEGIWTGQGGYKSKVVNNVSDPGSLDQTVWRRYGAAYQPRTNTVCWYVDDQLGFVAQGAAPEVARRQSFYVIAGAQTHGKNVPYEMHLRRVRAFSN
jgi:beta-glucanase (GH16 family)